MEIQVHALSYNTVRVFKYETITKTAYKTMQTQDLFLCELLFVMHVHTPGLQGAVETSMLC